MDENEALPQCGSEETSKLQARDPLVFGGTIRLLPEGAFEPLSL
jgi:hypothetical protein